MQHKVKIEEHFWKRITEGKKTSEVRINDRDYQVGDTLTFMILDEHENRDKAATYEGEYYVDQEPYEITHILNANQAEGIMEGFVVLSLKKTI